MPKKKAKSGGDVELPPAHEWHFPFQGDDIELVDLCREYEYCRETLRLIADKQLPMEKAPSWLQILYRTVGELSYADEGDFDIEGFIQLSAPFTVRPFSFPKGFPYTPFLALGTGVKTKLVKQQRRLRKELKKVSPHALEGGEGFFLLEPTHPRRIHDPKLNEQKHRRFFDERNFVHDAAIFRIPWEYNDSQLLQAFELWLQDNRPLDAVRTKGRRPDDKALADLKALGVFRLRKQLTAPQVIERIKASPKLPNPPYEHPHRYSTAKKRAIQVLLDDFGVEL